MRKIIWLMHASLDGFAAGPNGEIDWIYLEDELFEDVHNMVQKADTALWTSDLSDHEKLLADCGKGPQGQEA